jgi:hypothetical protein
MRSLADDLRRQDREAFASLPVEERIRRVFEMGEIGLEAFRQAQESTAGPRSASSNASAGRRPSKCMEELIG